MLASPVMQAGVLTFVCPENGFNVDDPMFRFRILKGHTVENLIKQRDFGIWVYFGFAVMGAITVYVGQDMLRTNEKARYV